MATFKILTREDFIAESFKASVEYTNGQKIF